MLDSLAQPTSVPEAPWRSVRAWDYVLIGLITALLRLTVLLAAPPDLYEGMTLERDGRLISEEIQRGNVARDLLLGPLVPLADSKTNDFSGGSLVVSIVATPFVAVFGHNLLALRMTSLVFSCMASILFFATLARFFPRGRAWLLSLPFVVAPPGYAIVSCTAYGTHLENNALAMLLVYFAVLGWERRGAAAALCAGVVSGFAVYFSYSALLLIAVIHLLECTRDRRWPLRKTSAWKLVGTTIGLIPVITSSLASGGKNLMIYEQPLGDHLPERTLAQTWSRLATTLSDHFPTSVYLPDMLGSSRIALGTAVLLVLGLALVGALVRRRAWRAFWPTTEPRARGIDIALLCALHPLLFLAAQTLSSFDPNGQRHWAFSYRYFYIALPTLLLGAAVGFGALWNHSRAGARAAVVASSGLTLLFLCGTLAQLRFDELGRLRTIPSYHDGFNARVVARQRLDDLPALDSFVDHVVRLRPPAVQEEMFRAMGGCYRWFLKPGRKFGERQQAECAAFERARAHMQQIVPTEYAPYFSLPGAAPEANVSQGL